MLSNKLYHRPTISEGVIALTQASGDPGLNRPFLLVLPRLAAGAVRNLIILALLVVLVVGSAYAILTWDVGRPGSAFRQAWQKDLVALEGRLDDFDSRLENIEKLLASLDAAASDAASGEGFRGAVLGALNEIQALQAERDSLKAELDARFKTFEDNWKAALGERSDKAAALAVRFDYRSLLFKAEAELLKAKVDLAEQNLGKARSELALAEASLSQAAGKAQEGEQAEINAMVDQIRQIRQDLVAGLPTAADRLELLWHRLSDFTVR